MKKIRKPYRAGQFYPGNKSNLIKMIGDCFNNKSGPVSSNRKFDNVISGIVPHAGYIFSGPVAAYFYKSIMKEHYDTVCILGPNHTGLGPDISVFHPEGVWQTPICESSVDGDFSEFCFENGLEIDLSAHEFEHSIEVQLPFLQYLYEDNCKIVPICIKNQSIECIDKVSNVINKAVKKFSSKKILFIASTDLNHFGTNFGITPPEDVSLNDFITEKDNIIIDKIKKLEGKELVELVSNKDFTMCGYGPVAVVLNYLKELKVKYKLNSLNYNNSLHYMPSDSAVGYYSANFVIQ